jgi:23S rRNA (guanosine2251-2'-O)-methyltransferase
MRKLANEELNRKSLHEFRGSSKTPIIIVLDNVRSLNNVGSVFRTADAFLIEGIYLCGITGTPPHKEIQKTALGATESITWKYTATTMEAVKELKQMGYSVCAIEQAESACMLHKFMPEKQQKMAIIFGNEVKGVEQEVIDQSDHVIEIPQVGTKHSLNIAVSVGIVVWDLFQKLV